MRILQVITAFHLGGAEEVSVNLAIGLAARGHQCCVVGVKRPATRDEPGKRQLARLDAAGVDYYEIPGNGTGLDVAMAPLRLAFHCRKWRPDIIHSHTDIPDFVTSLATRLRRAPVARTIHNSVLWPTHQTLGRITESGFRNDLVIFLSEATRKSYLALREKYGLPVSAHQVMIHNGVPIYPEAETATGEDLVRDYGAEPAKTQFCFAGRFTEQKGLDLLLQAVALLPERLRETFQLHAFGKGEGKEGYEDIIAAQGLPVLLHEPTADIGRLFPAFDAVLMPSRYEGLALVPLHALAGNVPVLAFRAPGLVDALPPEWPILIERENPQAFADAMAKFLDGGFDAVELQQLGQRWIEEHFTIDRMVERYEASYNDYLSRVGSRS